ncbi:hypothetical protein NKG94_10975 [Micromonospora sp. M12]
MATGAIRTARRGTRQTPTAPTARSAAHPLGRPTQHLDDAPQVADPFPPSPTVVTRSPSSSRGSGAGRNASSSAVNGAVRDSGAISGTPTGSSRWASRFSSSPTRPGTRRVTTSPGNRNRSVGYSSTACPAVPVTTTSPATNSSAARVTATTIGGPARKRTRSTAVSSTSIGRTR